MTRQHIEILYNELLNRLNHNFSGTSDEYDRANADALDIVKQEFTIFFNELIKLGRPATGNTAVITLIDVNIPKSEVHMDAMFAPVPEEGDELTPAQKMGMDLLQIIAQLSKPKVPTAPTPRRDQ